MRAITASKEPADMATGWTLSMAVPALRGPNGVLVDIPGSYHNAAAGMSFADGHSIIHRFQDARTYQPSALNRGPSPNNPDTDYLASISSAPNN